MTSSNTGDLREKQEKTATNTAQGLESLPEDLQEVVKSWAHLPAHIKAAIQVLASASQE
jgi:hypothetical protein